MEGIGGYEVSDFHESRLRSHSGDCDPSCVDPMSVNWVHISRENSCSVVFIVRKHFPLQNISSIRVECIKSAKGKGEKSLY